MCFSVNKLGEDKGRNVPFPASGEDSKKRNFTVQMLPSEPKKEFDSALGTYLCYRFGGVPFAVIEAGSFWSSKRIRHI